MSACAARPAKIAAVQRRILSELLLSDGWAVAGVARSQSTLDGVSAAGALALKADVTDPASVYGVLEQAAYSHGPREAAVRPPLACSPGSRGRI